MDDTTMIPQALKGVAQQVATGDLPGNARVGGLLHEAHRQFLSEDAGRVADYIPALADADPDLFGLAMVEVSGQEYDAGDSLHMFSLQSISKMFVYALAIQEHGHARVREIVGVNNTGLPFNSVMALELNNGHPMNPMVNAGAIATTALIAGADDDERWRRISEGLSLFAGRDLDVDEDV